ncbi:hypothetical protein KIPB_012087 [Kipferlia bialata]|uniref:Uncharacterized protein n=1 Tax=Kipferlia bialata TaxID=797122 RepID=A0A9K3D5Q0_9EUKA|nr:hypothetical protein KIPB_012087 [Kipferlia bialata]|eukprot:g12087.t1
MVEWTNVLCNLVPQFGVSFPLVGIEKQEKLLRAVLTSAVEAKTSLNVLVVGRPGSGRYHSSISSLCVPV